ncbi:MAG TPA: DUF3093 domain-containing protein [Streptosporangiaceae bacterium]|nr:DUF3093 domain-containing protein [Streptosporangiaceae bacterium]
MYAYQERLRPPVSWWLLGLTTVALLGAELAVGAAALGAKLVAGSGGVLGWLVYVGLLAGCAAALLVWGRATVTVTAASLGAGAAELPISAVGEVTPLDRAQTQALRGSRADPAAHVFMRPYLRYSVYVEVSDPAQPAPYWLVGTSHPVELAAAIEGSRPAAQADQVSMG